MSLTNYYADAGIINVELIPEKLAKPAAILDNIVSQWCLLPDGSEKAIVREIIFEVMEHLVQVGKEYLSEIDPEVAKKLKTAKIIESDIVAFEVSILIKLIQT